MKIDNTLLDKLSNEAKETPRLRMNLDMRNSSNDNSQRMLNALEPGTILPIHRHPDTSETVVIVRGTAIQYFYDDKGNITEKVRLEPGADCVGIQVPVGEWHRIEALEPGTVIFEAKDGAYQPTSEADILTL